MAKLDTLQAILSIFVLAFFVASSVAQTAEKPKELVECQQQLKVSDEEMGQLEKDGTPSEKIKCFLKCLGEKFGIYKDGKLIESKILADIKANSQNNPANQQKEMAIFNECKNKSGSSPCDTAWVIYKCVRTAAQKVKL